MGQGKMTKTDMTSDSYPGGKVREIARMFARSSANLAEVRGLTRISAIIIAYVNPRYAELR